MLFDIQIQQLNISCGHELTVICLSKHLIYGWLSQSLMEKLPPIYEMLNHNTVDSFMKNPHGSQNSIYPNLINELPDYLMQAMTRFALCFPEFVQLALQPTATVVALKKELCLWAVRIWYDSVSIHFDKMCSPMYVFQTSWDVSTQELPSIFIYFNRLNGRYGLGKFTGYQVLPGIKLMTLLFVM